MRKAILEISSVLLCGLLIYNSLGYFLVLSAMRIAIRQQKWAQLRTLPDDQLSTFVFTIGKPDSKLKIENEHEIIVDGKLYDIVRKSICGNQIRYFCKYDHEEEAFIAKTRLFNTSAQQMPLKNTTRLIVDKIIKTGILIPDGTTEMESYGKTYCNFRHIRYTRPYLQVASPPPQTVS